jgi:alpha-glucosidase
MRHFLDIVVLTGLAFRFVWAEYVDPAVLDACPGYKATKVSTEGNTLTANLVLAGQPCNVFGNDTKTLKLEVDYETGECRLFMPPIL